VQTHTLNWPPNSHVFTTLTYLLQHKMLKISHNPPPECSGDW